MSSKLFIKVILVSLVSNFFLSCYSFNEDSIKHEVLYKSDNLIINQISENVYVHISYKETQDYGNVACNGMIVRDKNEVIVFDTPTNNKSSEELIKWVLSLDCKIKAVVPTHFHDDSLGGLQTFHSNGIPSYSFKETIRLAKEQKYEVPLHSFDDCIVLELNSKKVIVSFFGEGHTKDNVVAYFPDEEVLFGGCLIKSIDSSRGFLGDAYVSKWSKTVKKIKKKYPNLKIVIPGHGEYGDSSLLDYTIRLFVGN